MSTKVKSPENLPKKPGVYIMRDANDEIIYIGKAKNLINRVRSYFREKLDRPKTQILMSHFDSLEYIVTNSEKEALILEATLIKKHRPRYNVQLKDDKRYPYVKITNEKYPRLIITRNITKNGIYYGPFTDVTSVKKTVKFLKSLFKIRTCRNMDGPCLNSQIDLCYAPCSGEISKEEYDEIINKIDLFFQGKYSVIVKNLKKEMAEAAENEQFEKAAVLRDQITSIEEIMEKQFVDLVDDDLDQDVIAIAPNDNEVVVIIMPIRNGKIVGRDDFLMSGSQYESNSEILFAFIQQYYGFNRHIPKQILLNEPIDDTELLEEWLSDLRGNKVYIKVPMKGVKLRLVNMAQKNAEIIKHQKKAMENSLTGFEFACGIPGTIGGAVFMNAGAYDGEIAHVIESAEIIDEECNIVRLSNKDLDFGYRSSIVMKKGYTVLSAVFKLEKGQVKTIKELVDDLTNKRESKQPLEYPSAGSTFKRPTGYFAGKLLSLIHI